MRFGNSLSFVLSFSSAFTRAKRWPWL